MDAKLAGKNTLDVKEDAASGQVENPQQLAVNGDAYFQMTFDPKGTISYGWYDFVGPFPVNVSDGIFREGYTRPAAQDHGDSGLGDACIFCQISCRDLISFTHLYLLSGLPVPLSADVCRGFQPFFETLFRNAFRNVLPVIFSF
jgi:hypothetical protein